MRRLSMLLGVALFVAASSRRADASPGFPASIKTDVPLSYDLGTTHCIICHHDNFGGYHTVVRPFGLAMMQAGLRAENYTALQTALNTLEANKTDSDCDGTIDIEQLKMGRDPNPPGEYIDGSNKMAPPDDAGCMAGGGAPVPVYGCAAQVSRAPAAWPGAAAVVALLGGLLGRAGRRRRVRRFTEGCAASERAPRSCATADPVPAAW
jgi:hypothetical protein